MRVHRSDRPPRWARAAPDRTDTPPTNLARWGEGCKPYAVASDLPGVLTNIARFGEEVEKSHALQKRLAWRDFLAIKKALDG